MTNPDTSPTSIKVYDLLAPEYDETDHQAMRLLEKLEEDVIAKELPRYCTDITHKRIANIGCGTGRHTGFFQRLGNKYVFNLDFSMNMLSVAREKHEGGGHHYVRADAQRIPFSTAVFDIVIAGLFDSIHDQASFFHEARRILAPGGLLIVSQPNIHSAQIVRPALGLGVAETGFHMRDGSFHRIPSVLSTPLSLDEQLVASGFGNTHILEVPAGETALTPRISQLVQQTAQKLGIEPSAVPLITVGFAVAS